jgi:hypothetical protein
MARINRVSTRQLRRTALLSLIQRTQSRYHAAAQGIPVALVPSPADDFNDMVSHHYIESFDNHRKGKSMTAWKRTT